MTTSSERDEGKPKWRSSVETGDVEGLRGEIDCLGLDANIVDLELRGLTVVQADRLGNNDTIDAVFEALCRISEERTGRRPDVAGGETHRDVSFPTMYYFFLEDPAFADLLLNEHALALATYLLGRSFVLSACNTFMKGPGTALPSRQLQLALHSDMQLHPQPFPLHAERINVSWLLSDYSQEGGALAYLPGSHRLCRHPSDREDDAAAVPVEALRGSLVIWHGNTWHGSFPRSLPGLRTSIAFELSRPHLRPSEPYHLDVSEEFLAGKSPRLRALLGRDVPVGWRTEGPDPRKLYGSRIRSLLD